MIKCIKLSYMCKCITASYLHPAASHLAQLCGKLRPCSSTQGCSWTNLPLQCTGP